MGADASVLSVYCARLQVYTTIEGLGSKETEEKILTGNATRILGL